MLNSTLFLSLIQVCPLITRSYLQAKLLAWTKVEKSSFFRIDELSNSYFSKNKFLFWNENVMVRLSHICNEEKIFQKMIVNSFSHEYLSEQLQDHSDVNKFCFLQLNHFNWHHFRVSHIPELFLFLQGFFIHHHHHLYIIISYHNEWR